MATKVTFGINKAHYAVITRSGGSVTYGTPVAIPGSVNLTLDIAGGADPFYADNMVYFNNVYNNGYTGSLEVAKFPESFLSDIFGFTTDANSVVFEDATAEPKQVALLFEISGDDGPLDVVLYDVQFERPGTTTTTNTDSRTINTETCNFTAVPSRDPAVLGKPKAYTEDATAQATWFSSVYVG